MMTGFQPKTRSAINGMSMAGDDVSSSLLQQTHFEAILSRSLMRESTEKCLFESINLLRLFMASHTF
jgi:hypothetical protein